MKCSNDDPVILDGTSGSQLEERSSQSSINVREERAKGSITMVIPPGSTIHEWQTLREETYMIEVERKRNAEANKEL